MMPTQMKGRKTSNRGLSPSYANNNNIRNCKRDKRRKKNTASGSLYISITRRSRPQPFFFFFFMFCLFRGVGIISFPFSQLLRAGTRLFSFFPILLRKKKYIFDRSAFPSELSARSSLIVLFCVAPLHLGDYLNTHRRQCSFPFGVIFIWFFFFFAFKTFCLDCWFALLLPSHRHI